MTNLEYVQAHVNEVVRDVPGFPKPGIIFKDIVPVFENPDYARKVVEAFVEVINDKHIEFDKLLVPETRGFLFGIPLGLKLNKPIALARKPGKLPLPGVAVSYNLEYGNATLVVSENTIKPGEKVLILDDLLATGGSGGALAKICKLVGAEVVGFMFFVELTPLKGRDNLKPYPVYSLVDVDAY